MQSRRAPSPLAWYPQATAATLPPMMLETDPRLSCQHLEDFTGSIISNSNEQCPVYRYSNTLVYKPVCRKRETKFIHLAGILTLPVVSKVGIVDDVGSSWYQKGAVLELGEPLVVGKIAPADRAAIARQMISLVTRLHDKGIIHGDVRLENFVEAPGDDDRLMIVGFSGARMGDDSDLASWPAGTPLPEYASPNQSLRGGPSRASDDDFALAVSIWAVFAGENPSCGLFSSNEGKMPDLTRITDNELFCAVVDILAEGGFNVEHTGALSRRCSMGIERTVSFPLSLFGADPDDTTPGEPTAMKPKPQICPHCLKIAMAKEEPPMVPRPQHPGVYQAAGLSDYAMQWLQGQQIVAEPCAIEKARTRPALEPSKRAAAQQQRNLHIETNRRHPDVETPVWSSISHATSGTATVTAGDRYPGRGRSTTVLRAPRSRPPIKAEVEAGCEIVTRASLTEFAATSSAASDTSMQRNMSTWSLSSCGSSVADDVDTQSERHDGDGASSSGGTSPPLTPMPPGMKRLQMTASLESVALDDDDGGARLMPEGEAL